MSSPFEKGKMVALKEIIAKKSTLTLLTFMTTLLCFSSQKIAQIAQKQPAPWGDVIIERPLL